MRKPILMESRKTEDGVEDRAGSLQDLSTAKSSKSELQIIPVIYMTFETEINGDGA